MVGCGLGGEWGAGLLAWEVVGATVCRVRSGRDLQLHRDAAGDGAVGWRTAAAALAGPGLVRDAVAACSARPGAAAGAGAGLTVAGDAAGNARADGSAAGQYAADPRRVLRPGAAHWRGSDVRPGARSGAGGQDAGDGATRLGL